MRVSDLSRANLLRRELSRTSSELGIMSERLSTGRVINRLSDEPELAVQADRLTTEDQALEAYSQAAYNARAWLATQDGALQSAEKVLQRIGELAITAAAPQGAGSLEGIAVELEGIRAQMMDLANTEFNGRPVFGGFADEAVRVVAGVVQYVGDTGAVQRRVTEGTVVQVNVSGNDVFGFAAADDIFGVIDDLVANVRAGDTTAISGSDLVRLEAAEKRVLAALGTVGARGNQVTRAIGAAERRQDEIRAYHGSIVNADLAETVLDVTLAENAYQAVLAATARLQLPSLGDYLR